MRTAQDEAVALMAEGSKQITLAELRGMLGRLGYRLGQLDGETYRAKWMTGPRAGESYPAVCEPMITEADSGLSAFHHAARRDDRFQQLQRLRFEGGFFVINRGRILQI